MTTSRDGGAALAVLERARERISDPKRWCRNANARDASGHRLNSGRSPGAVQWCALGALAIEAPKEGEYEEASKALGEVDRFIAVTNDDKGHDAVLAIYDRAIALLRAREVRP